MVIIDIINIIATVHGHGQEWFVVSDDQLTRDSQPQVTILGDWPVTSDGKSLQKLY